MPKMKSRRGAVKRLRRTGSGKVKRNKAYASHLMTSKTRKQKRRLRKSAIIAKADERRILKQMGKGA
jgi:large subunit ribosomal protein L35